MAKNKNRTNKGFTMIEIAISSAILTVVFGGMTVFGVQLIKNNNRVQVIKNTVENVSYAIEFINKAVRTSNNIKEGDCNGDVCKELFVIDNYTDDRYCFYFDDSKIKRKIGSSGNSCSEIADESVLAGNSKVKVEGTFSVKKTDRDEDQRGFIRTNIKLTYEVEKIDDFADDEMIIQSSVSLRDYGFNSP